MLRSRALALVITVPLVAAAAAAGSSAIANPAMASTNPAPATTRLELTITSTSDYANVVTTGATYPLQRVLGQPSGTVTTSADTIGYNGPIGTVRKATVDLITLGSGSAVSFKLEQGKQGASSFTAVDSRTGKVVASGSSQGAKTTSTSTVSPNAVFSSGPLPLPHGDSRRLALAFYYPWFPTPPPHPDKMSELPSPGYSTETASGVNAMLAQARAAGIDGLIASWDGDDARSSELNLLVKASETQHTALSVVLETAETDDVLGHANKDKVELWLKQALTRTGSSSWLRADDGLPVVFAYSMSDLSAGDWYQVLADVTAAGHPVHIIGDATDPTYAPDEMTRFSYTDVNTPTDQARQWVDAAISARGAKLLDPSQRAVPSIATVSPGYNDSKLRGDKNPVVPRNGGQTYEANWDAAVAADPDWVLVTSFNEWYEGTSIEPGTVNGDLAMRETANRTSVWRGPSARRITSGGPGVVTSTSALATPSTLGGAVTASPATTAATTAQSQTATDPAALLFPAERANDSSPPGDLSLFSGGSRSSEDGSFGLAALAGLALAGAAAGTVVVARRRRANPTG